MSMSPREQLDQLLTKSSESSYDEIATRLRKAQLLFREYVCQQLQEPLNAKLQTMPCGSYETKQRLALWLNSEFLSFGIAARCPKTDLPCSIHAEPGRSAIVGQLRMRPVEDDTRRTFSSSKLFDVALMPRPLAKTRFEKWIERASDQGREPHL